jgi:hypothetical protein
MSEKEQAEVAQTKSAALRNYTSSPSNMDILPPEMFFKLIMNMSDDAIELINQYRDAQITEEDEDFINVDDVE